MWKKRAKAYLLWKIEENWESCKSNEIFQFNLYKCIEKCGLFLIQIDVINQIIIIYVILSIFVDEKQIIWDE